MRTARSQPPSRRSDEKGRSSCRFLPYAVDGLVRFGGRHRWQECGGTIAAMQDDAGRIGGRPFPPPSKNNANAPGASCKNKIRPLTVAAPYKPAANTAKTNNILILTAKAVLVRTT